MILQDLIETYDTQAETRCICPIAHTQIIARIGIMLDEQSNILAAAKIRQSIFAPCTAKSECRSSNIAPHLVHDNVSYVAPKINPNRHKAYMDQLTDFVTNTDDNFCKIVLKYLEKDTIYDDLKHLIDFKDNPMTVITFGIKGSKENTVNQTWIDYYLSKLPKNGLCAITGDLDYIPDAYPGNMRYPSDMGKLFMTKPDKLNGMPQLLAGYIASQKIIHTLQSFFVVWAEQGDIPLTDIIVSKNRGNRMCKACLVCGGKIKRKRNKMFCSYKCAGLYKQNYSICPICGKTFKKSPSDKTVKTCGEKECKRAYRAKIMTEKFMQSGHEAVKKSPNTGHFETHHAALEWCIVSPEGDIYKFKNLVLWSEQHKEILPVSPRTGNRVSVKTFYREMQRLKSDNPKYPPSHNDYYGWRLKKDDKDLG